jgi:hypothetical protein
MALLLSFDFTAFRSAPEGSTALRPQLLYFPKQSRHASVQQAARQRLWIHGLRRSQGTALHPGLEVGERSEQGSGGREDIAATGSHDVSSCRFSATAIAPASSSTMPGFAAGIKAQAVIWG